MDKDTKEKSYQKRREKRRSTKDSHAKMRPFTYELKLDLKCLNKSVCMMLYSWFTECRWLYNYLLSLSKEELNAFTVTQKDITSLDKDGNIVERHLTMPAKFIQSVKENLIANMCALSAKRTKTGKANGKLKFKSSYNTIYLNQYGNTHWIKYGPEGNRSGKYKNTVHIVGIKRPIKVFGMDQIPANAELSVAKLVKRPSGIYLQLTCYLPQEKDGNGTYDSESPNAIGVDFGIKTTITTSEGEKFDIIIRESERLKGLQKKFARQEKGSKGWYKTKHLIEREYEKITNRRTDKANKVYHALTAEHNFIVMQDENINGWQKGLFGKQVQNSALGTLKFKLSLSPKVLMIDRFFPSTKMCPVCGKIKEDITLSDRTYICDNCGYIEDRDVKSAIALLLAGKHLISRSCVERTSTPVERMSDFDTQFELWERSSNKREAGNLSLGNR